MFAIAYIRFISQVPTVHHACMHSPYRLRAIKRTQCNLPLPRITQSEKYVSLLCQKTTKSAPFALTRGVKEHQMSSLSALRGVLVCRVELLGTRISPFFMYCTRAPFPVFHLPFLPHRPRSFSLCRSSSLHTNRTLSLTRTHTNTRSPVLVISRVKVQRKQES